MRSWDKRKILELLFASSRIALEIKKDPRTIAKDDKSAVTLADGKIEEFLTQELSEELCPLIGEETSPRKGDDFLRNALANDCWIVDPIDGTANFAAGYDVWAISIGFARKGVLEEGAVYLPEKGDLLMTDGEKVFYGNVKEPSSATALEEALKEFSSPEKEYQIFSMLNLSQKVCKQAQVLLPNPVIVIGSCVASGVSLARGLDAAYMTSAKLWDLAGILPSLRRLGFYSAALVPGGSDMQISSCRILPEYYKMDFAAKDAFALHRTVILARDKKLIELLRKNVKISE